MVFAGRRAFQVAASNEQFYYGKMSSTPVSKFGKTSRQSLDASFNTVQKATCCIASFLGMLKLIEEKYKTLLRHAYAYVSHYCQRFIYH